MPRLRQRRDAWHRALELEGLTSRWLGTSMQNEVAWVGIDVGFAKGRGLSVAMVTLDNGSVVPASLRHVGCAVPRGSGNAAVIDPGVTRSFAEDTADYLRAVERHEGVRIARIAIDAPAAPAAEGQRASEKELDAQGISYYATPTAAAFDDIRARVRQHLDSGGAEDRIPHANQLWMLAGFALFDVLSRDWKCIEVYPYTIAEALGVGHVSKKTAHGRDERWKAVASHTGWPSGPGDIASQRICYGSAHDRQDAYLSAWVASLDTEHRVGLGSPSGEDTIWVPRLGRFGDHGATNAVRSRAAEPRPSRAAPESRFADRLLNLFPGRTRRERAFGVVAVQVDADPGVLVHVTPDGYSLRLPVLRWLGPSEPEHTTRPWQAAPPTVSDTELHALIESAIAARAAEFRDCMDCGRRTAPGYMHDNGLCMGCATSRHGIVY